MTNILPPPDREAFEREVKGLLPNDGDISTIARFVQRDASTVSKMLNPFSTEKHNPFYLFVLFLWALDCLRDGLADEVLKIVNRERCKWRKGQVTIAEHPAKTTANIGIQFSEFLCAELEGKSYETQIAEIVDVEEAVKRKKEQIIQQRNQKYFGELKAVG